MSTSHPPAFLTSPQRIHIAAQTMSRKLGVNTRDAEALMTRLLSDLVRAALEEQQRNESLRQQRLAGIDETHRCHGYVKVPFMAQAKDGQPLQQCINNAARKTAMSPWRVALILTFLLEEMSIEVGLGNVVRIPGFGAFGPILWTSKDTGEQAVYPRFVASRGFRQHIRSACEPCKAKNEELCRYQRHHHPSSRPDRVGSRTRTAMDAWRKIINAQSFGTASSPD